MEILAIMRALRQDTVQSAPLHQRKSIDDWLSQLERRYSCEGNSFLDKLTHAYKAAMGACCLNGSLPDSLEGIGSLNWDRTASGFGFTTLFLGCLSWPSKLSFAGESTGSADFEGFLARSRECSNFSGANWEDLLPMSRRDRVTIDHLVPFKQGRGRHGPGATYEKLRGWDKWLAFEATPRPIIKMTSVPKDRNKRRLIGVEHCLMQFIQQSLADGMRASPWFRRWTTLHSQADHIGFPQDAEEMGRYIQQNNAARAHVQKTLSGSSKHPREYCTVDLSDASDRIPLSLVEYLLPSWYPHLAVASSAYANVNGSLHPLGMIATMGDGFCFELETLIFHIVASLSGRIYDESGGFTARRLEYYADQCRVYGDDIIIPAEWFTCFEHLCSLLGWVISYHKTGRTPEFLETCGTYINASRCETARRLCPTLETVEKTGKIRELGWNTQVERLATALAFHDAGFTTCASLIALPVLKAARYRWNPYGLQRHEIKLTTSVSGSRPLSATEESRLFAYWVSGLTDQREEDTGRETIGYAWRPLRDYAPLLHPTNRV